MKNERDALQREVFPKLRNLCMKKGCSFQAIDLRWGVSDEASLDQQTMKICLDEIERSQKVSPKPNFIVLIGDRYGWKPLPYEIPSDEFKRILENISETEEELMLWKEEQPEDKKGWYREDLNAVPPVYCLQHRTGGYSNYDIWSPLENKLHSILFKAVSKLDLSENDFLKYYASATEQEVVKGALKVKDADEHVFCFFRHFENPDESNNFADLDVNGDLDEESHERLNDLRQKLRKKLPENNIKDYYVNETNNELFDEYLDDLCKDVYNSLEKIILEQVKEIGEDDQSQKSQVTDDLDKEINIHEMFRKERIVLPGKFRPQPIIDDRIILAIDEYLKEKNLYPLVIYGSGPGKSVSIAKSVENAQNKLPYASIITRFIGCTPESSDLCSLLGSLYRQINRIYGENDSNICLEYNKLVPDFAECLKYATSQKPLIIFIDALNLLSKDSMKNVDCLSYKLPENVHMVISTSDEHLPFVKNKIPESNLLQLEPINNFHELDSLKDVWNWLRECGRTLQSKQREEIEKRFQCNGLPVCVWLYKDLSFIESLKWKSYTNSEENILSSDISNIIRNIFNKFSLKSNHGEVLVSSSLAYISASKYGLSEDELIDLLSRDKKVFHDFIMRARSEPSEILKSIKEVLREDEKYLEEKPGFLFEKLQNDPEFFNEIFDRIQHNSINLKLPVIIWSRLYFDMKDYLIEKDHHGLKLMSFAHRQIADVAYGEYLSGNEKSFRLSIADYFESKDIESRKVDEIPWQLYKSKSWEKLAYFISNIDVFLILMAKREDELAIYHQDDLTRYWDEIKDNYDMVELYTNSLKLYENACNSIEKLSFSYEQLSNFMEINGEINASKRFFKRSKELKV